MSRGFLLLPTVCTFLLLYGYKLDFPHFLNAGAACIELHSEQKSL